MSSSCRTRRTVVAASVFVIASVAAQAAPVLIVDYKARTLKGDTIKTSGKHEVTVPYAVTIDDTTTKWSVTLNPTPDPTFLSLPDDLVGFKKILEMTFPKWTFKYADDQDKDLSLSDKSLVIHTYTGTNRSNLFDYTLGFAGAEIDVEYSPHGTDPKGAAVHWIQVVKDNHKLGKGGGYNVPENAVDNEASLKDPYYDTAFSADNTFFYDTPTRTNYQTHYWYAELFLVKQVNDDNGKGGRTVNIYDGLKWGWTNQSVPAPGTFSLLGTGILTLAALGGFRRRSVRRLRTG